MGGPSPQRSPVLARLLLRSVVRGEAAEFVIGDIEEAFHEDVLPRLGRAGARRWYWGQALCATGGVLRERAGIRLRNPEAASSETEKENKRIEGWMKGLIQDVLFALRTLARKPGFTAVALLTLALGIGANTAIFSVVNGVLLAELPLPDSEELVSIWTYDPADPDDFYNNSGPNIRDWQARGDWFEGVYAYAGGNMIYTNADGLTDMLPVAQTTANVLKVLEVAPVLGRGPARAEEGEGSPDVVVLGHGLWTSHFGADPTVVGRTMELDGRPHEIIGVLPAGFEMPRVAEAAAIVPWDFDIESRPRDSVWLGAVGRLQDDVTVREAQAAMNGLHAAISEDFPAETVNTALLIIGARDDIVGAVKPALLLLLGATAFLLLMACANVANLLLARASGRTIELAVRRSLGASRGRVVRQLLTENIVLAVGAGAAGTALAFVGKEVLLSMAPEGLPRIDQVVVDLRVLGFAVALMAATGLMFGLLPALLSTRTGPGAVMHDGGRGTVSNRQGRKVRNVLVVAQVAVAAVLMVGAGLLIQSFARLATINPGYDVEGVLVAEMNLPPGGYEEGEQRTAFYMNLIRRVEALPGVEVAGVTLIRPLSTSRINYELRIEGRSIPEPGTAPAADVGIATEGYFETFQVPILRGRSFAPQDTRDTQRVAVISRSLAALAFPDEEPVGQRISLVAGDWNAEPRWLEVVGVVGDVRTEGLGIDPNPSIYTNAFQQPQYWGNLVLRASIDPNSLVAPLRTLILEVEPRIPLPTIETMHVVKRESLAGPRFYTTLLTVFAGLALALSSVGLYGVLSYTVAARTGEIGVRMSFGADRSGIVRLVLREGLGVAAVGIALGLFGAFVLSRAMESLVFGVSTTDPITFVGIAVMLASVAGAACVIPALRAASVDPAMALRSE